ncbi:HAD hydrolase-like protein [Arthrobacter sp. zg-Y820]|uniref:HAD hydrolase-like protein n=1 Tax=unclassified Arthrobacter TaxID=235627 RepID=UPI00253FD77F|nr:MULTISPECIES: HAD hydrolase-like protein [unclassified Arthrobacter]MCC9196604.1 HAD hydrolase-like protein [Arthrobacter sp. zg-Y820]MDK1279466.1 HAD hydrolase-like protein [Arthrobacter sp. zg.Y820]MDK1358915.1 HAD hydrolase-like protein [Arthrobacter sp. zg-Y1219]WIB08156.1 HAD hydrolase-like protein [Arthrobacter sp. zg-Y820]
MKESRLLVLFDLDGTLVDPAGSITGGISTALAASGLPVPPAAELQRMVGPALVTSLREIAGVPEARVNEVIAHYRAGYRDTGMAQSRPYPGIEAAVSRLRADGSVVAVATQKPEPLAQELLRVQGLSELFDSVHGSPADEQAAAALDGKTTIIRAALDRHAGTYDRAVMVGDRRHDVEGAAANGLDCIGVSWGFAGDGELAAAGAAAVVDSAEELLAALLTEHSFRVQERACAHERL